MKATIIFAVISLLVTAGCKNTNRAVDVSAEKSGKRYVMTLLRDSIQEVADRFSGEIGVALITESGDTLAINNETKYPLMSVFKLHQALALCDLFEHTGQSLDSVVSIPRRRLNPDTWSPMLKEHSGDTISLPIRTLLSYTLTLSDNNASNWMFENLQSVSDADLFIATIIPRKSFSIKHTEADMGSDHSLAYENCTSPLGAAILIHKLYTDSIIATTDTDFICTTLDGCRTGQDRIAAALKDKEGVLVGHKTGSGYRNEEGFLTAHNDVGFVRLPDGSHYALAVFVKDFKGTEKDAATAIAQVSELVYSMLTK